MSLIIDDSHIDGVKKYLVDQCATLDSIISQYTSTMNTVVETGIMEGETAKAVKELLHQFEFDIKDGAISPGIMEALVERYCIGFIKRVDKADKQIY